MYSIIWFWIPVLRRVTAKSSWSSPGWSSKWREELKKLAGGHILKNKRNAIYSCALGGGKCRTYVQLTFSCEVAYEEGWRDHWGRKISNKLCNTHQEKWEQWPYKGKDPFKRGKPYLERQRAPDGFWETAGLLNCGMIGEELLQGGLRHMILPSKVPLDVFQVFGHFRPPVVY